MADLAPGDSVRGYLTLLYNNSIPGRDDLIANEMPFNEVGTYRVFIEISGLKGNIISSVIEVDVHAPIGDDLEIWEALRRNPGLALFIQSGDSGAKVSNVVEAEALLARLSNSQNSGYVCLALGRYYARKGSFARSLQYLSPAVKAGTGTWLRGQALLETSQVYSEKGDYLAAKEICQVAAAEYKETPIGPLFVALLSRIARESGTH
jgi:tetratricopeptide (TPR) repeat protein